MKTNSPRCDRRYSIATRAQSSMVRQIGSRRFVAEQRVQLGIIWGGGSGMNNITIPLAYFPSIVSKRS